MNGRLVVVVSMVVSLLAGLAAVGCGGARHPSTTVEETQYAALAPEEKAPVESAAAEVGQAQAALLQAQGDLSTAKRTSDIAQAEVKKSKADLAIEETNSKSAQEGHQADEMLSAKARLNKAEATLSYDKLEAKHESAEVDLANARVQEAQAWIYKAEATVQMEKARAINKNQGDTSPEGQEKLANFERQAADANHAHAKARQNTQRYEKAAATLKTEAEAAKAAIPAQG